MQKMCRPNHRATKKPPERNDPEGILRSSSLQCTQSRLALAKASGTQFRWGLGCGLRYYGNPKKIRAATTTTI